MTEWRDRFIRKLETVNKAASDRFERVAEETLAPTFDKLQDFTSQHGLPATAPLSERGVRTFKFTLTENAYVLFTFHQDGLEHCKFLSEFCVPNHEKLPPIGDRFLLGDIDMPKARRLFERVLDSFLDAFVETLEGQQEGDPNSARSERKSNRKNKELELEESAVRR